MGLSQSIVAGCWVHAALSNAGPLFTNPRMLLASGKQNMPKKKDRKHRLSPTLQTVHIPISSTSGSDPNLPPTPIQTRPLIMIRSSHFGDYISMGRCLIPGPRTAICRHSVTRFIAAGQAWPAKRRISRSANRYLYRQGGVHAAGACSKRRKVSNPWPIVAPARTAAAISTISASSSCVVPRLLAARA